MLGHDQAFWISVALGIVFLIVAISFAGAMYKMREKVHTAWSCINTACDCIFSTWGLLIWPLVGVSIKLACLTFMVFTSEMLLTCGTTGTSTLTIDGQKVHGVARHFNFTPALEGYIVLYAFGYYWILNMFNAV